MKRILEPSEIGSVAVFLSSNEAAAITGDCLSVSVVGKKMGVIGKRMSAHVAKVVGDPYSLVLNNGEEEKIGSFISIK